MAHKKLSILMAGGGTGGHLMPGIALSDALHEISPDIRITFLVPGKPVDIQILSKTHFEFFVNPMRSVPSSWEERKLFVKNFLAGWFETIRVFRLCRPGIVVGLGGYGSLSAGWLASLYGRPLVMLESNQRAGKVVRWLSRKCHTIYAPGLVEGLSCSRIKAFGIPLRKGLPVNKKMGFPKSQLTVLVMGGSQGARCVNQGMERALPSLEPMANRIKFIHLCGSDCEKMSEAYRKSRFNAEVFPFSHNMDELYEKSDLVIGRAGGSTISEITAVGLPSIMIPFERAAENHQVLNAQALEQAGAASIVRESELFGETLSHKIRELIDNQHLLEKMASAARSAGNPNASYEIAWDILGILNGTSATTKTFQSLKGIKYA